MEYTMFKKRFLSLSRDQRTNKWELTCSECGKRFEPPTTMLSYVYETCPKCGHVAGINYNAE